MNSTAPNPSNPEPAAPRTVRILVAEDSPVNRMLALKQLECLGYPAEGVANGTEVLAALARGPFEVILMDCHMPEMDGYEATWQIREAEKQRAQDPDAAPPAYIIAMTANSEADSREKCLSAGMDDFINKPVQLTELEAALHRALADRAAQKELDAVVDPVIIAGLRQLRSPQQKTDALAELIKLFLDEAPAQLAVMEKEAASRDAGAMSRALSASTALKGSAANLGVRNLAALADDYIQGIRSGFLSELLPLVQKGKAEFERARDALVKIAG